MKNSKKIIAIILTIIILGYIGYASYLLIVNPTNTYIIKEGTISEEDEATGYIIRDEEVIKGENYENGIYAIVAEGEKVAKGNSIFRYYSSSEKETSEKIQEINYKIQNLLENEENPPSADIKSIENQIEEKIKKLRDLNNYQEILEYQNNIDNLVSKKINFIGEISENSEIRQLVKEKKMYEEKLKNGAEYKTSEMSGIVSYRVDGLEDILSEDKFNDITEEYLNDLGLRTGQIISKSNESGKVVNNFKCYIAVTLNSELAMKAKVGNKVKLRISNEEELGAEIVQINEEVEKRTIIFKMNKITENLINHRKIAVDVIWWDATGLKVPIQALVEENGLNYVIRNKSGIETKVLVKVKKQTDKFAIITSYSLKDLEEIGYDEKDIKNYKKINNYDEILLNTKK